MNKQILIVACLGFISLASWAQADTLVVRVSGRVRSGSPDAGLAYVHVVNQRTGRGTITDTLGLFYLRMRSNDTLIFKSLGFEDKRLVLNDTLTSSLLFVEVNLMPTSYELQVVDVIALSRESQFRYDFIHMKPDNSRWENQLIIPGVTKEKYQWIRDEEKFNPKKNFSGPFSALYYKFSDEGKSLQKLAVLLEQDEREEAANKKYNRKLLANFTGYSGETLNNFYTFLNLTTEFVLQQNTYDLYLYIQSRIPLFENTYVQRDSLAR
ncbi:MAG: hypothetical protein AB7E36_11600 [Salinivirgaceae bacterium]